MDKDFETLPVGFAVSDFEAVVLDSGQAPTHVIRANNAWSIKVDWKTSGALSAFLVGNWHVHAYLESIGPGQELRLGGNLIRLTPGPGTISYSSTINVAPNTVVVQGGHPNESVPMKLVVTVTYDWADNVPGPMAGYIEGPVIQFFNPAN